MILYELFVDLLISLQVRVARKWDNRTSDFWESKYQCHSKKGKGWLSKNRKLNCASVY